MNKLLGYSLMGIGLLGFIFFLNYQGTAIPVKELWFVLSIFIIIVGAYFFVKHKLERLNNQQDERNDNRLSTIEMLKSNGDKIIVTLDNAEVKSRSYRQEIINEGLPSRLEMLDGLYDSNRSYKSVEVQQTYVVFYKEYNGITYKFVSNPTRQNADTLRRYIDSHRGIDLYIDPKNPTSYYFDLPYM